jgi:REP element-mobilizing transposase RayT
MNKHVGPRASRPHRGWHERGYLPHFDGGAVAQMITFRLADSLPREVCERIAAISANLPDRYLRLEKLIDQGRGCCMLGDPGNANVVRDALAHFDGERYQLLAWVIMPNHVHVLIEQGTGYPLENLVHSWKSFTSKAIGKRNGQIGKLWAIDYFDRYIRNDEHYRNAVFYIENNPVKAKLATKPEEWEFSSAAARV